MADALCPSCKASEFLVKAVEPFALLYCRACGHILAIAPCEAQSSVNPRGREGR